MANKTEIPACELSPLESDVFYRVANQIIPVFQKVLRDRSVTGIEYVSQIETVLEHFRYGYIPACAAPILDYVCEQVRDLMQGFTEIQTGSPERLERALMAGLVDIGERFFELEDGRELPKLKFVAWEEIPNIEALGIKKPVHGMAYKGGVARLLLKHYKREVHGDGLINQTYSAELPLNDVDILVFKDEDETMEDFLGRGIQLGDEFDADAPGVEYVTEPLTELAIQHKMNRADVTFNQVIATSNGLYYTEAAKEAVLGGTIRGIPAGRNLWGMDSFTAYGHVYLTSKSLHRLVCKVAEGKAVRFETPKYNLGTDLRRFWFVALNRFLNKSNRAMFVYRWWQCAREMKQTLSGSPQEFIKELSAKYPDFKFGNGGGAGVPWVAEKVFFAVMNYIGPSKSYQPPDEKFNADPICIEPDMTMLRENPDFLGGVEKFLCEKFGPVDPEGSNFSI